MSNWILLSVGFIGIAIGFGAALFLFLLAYRTAQFNYEEKKLEMKWWEGSLRGTAETEAPESAEDVPKTSSQGSSSSSLSEHR